MSRNHLKPEKAEITTMCPDWPTLRLLQDKPIKLTGPVQEELYKKITGVDSARCEQLAEQIASQIVDFVSNKKSPDHIFPRIGVFGGLGQGKTTAIHWAFRETERKLENNEWFFPWRETWKVEWFDAAHYKNNDLEYELDRVLGGIGSGSFSVIRTMVTYLVLLWTILLLFGELKCFFPGYPLSSVVSSSAFRIILSFGPIIASLLKPWSYWWRSGQRSMTLGTWRWWRQGWKLLSRRANILVIDNLDRASLSQQRSVLRALYKHRDELRCAVIVAFDESRFLSSKPDPEAPAELLRKAINVEVRLPMRVLTDSLRLSWQALSQAAELNPGLNMILLNSKAIGALALILELQSALQPVSPRLSKHTINNTLFFMAQTKPNGLPSVEDWRAALRLQALFLVWPALRNDADSLREILQYNRLDGLAVLANKISFEGSANDDFRKNLAILIFNETRSFFPADNDWSPWLAVWNSRAFGNPEITNDALINIGHTFSLPAFDTVNHLLDGLLRLADGMPLSYLANITELLAGAFPQMEKGTTSVAMSKVVKDAAQALLPLTELLLQRMDQVCRQRFLNQLWAAADLEYLLWVFETIDKSEFYGRLAELLWTNTSADFSETQKLFDKYWQSLGNKGIGIDQHLRLLQLCPASRFRLSEALRFASAGHGLGAEKWLADYGYQDKANGLPGFVETECIHLSSGGLDETSLVEIRPAAERLKRFWPPIPVDALDNTGLMIEYCSAWRGLLSQGSPTETPLEFFLLKDKAFEIWLENHHPHRLLPALTEFFTPLTENSPWSVVAWQDFLNYASTPVEQKIDRMLSFRKRFEPLCRQPSSNITIRKVQCLVAAAFPGKLALKRLMKNWPQEDANQWAIFTTGLKASIRHWTWHCAEAAWQEPKSNFGFHGCYMIHEYAELLAQAQFKQLNIIDINSYDVNQ
jgi:hypothetical protein